MKASEKRKAAHQRNIYRKTAERLEVKGIRKAQAKANDEELKRLCVKLATLQAKNSGENEGKSTAERLKTLHARCQGMYQKFRSLPAHKQPEAFHAALRYLATGGDAGEFIKFGGVPGGQQNKLEEQTEQGNQVHVQPDV